MLVFDQTVQKQGYAYPVQFPFSLGHDSVTLHSSHKGSSIKMGLWME